MKILVACEESQRVCAAFRAKGHYAFSCDILPASGGYPEWHIQYDVEPLLNGYCSFVTMDNCRYSIDGPWDMIIAFPPCTYLTVTGNRWFNIDRYGQKAIERAEKREAAVKFFMSIANAACERIAIENPVGIMSTRWIKPDQIIQPYMFGDPYEKKTCLWLKNLPLLKCENEILPPQRKEFASGKTMPAWYAECWSLPAEERARVRSMTFQGVANAMANQWGGVM